MNEFCKVRPTKEKFMNFVAKKASVISNQKTIQVNLFLFMFLSKFFLFLHLYFEPCHDFSYSIDDDYVPKKGDIVTFKKMLMPPKNEKPMAVHIKLLHLAEGVKHESWEEAVEHDMENRRPSRSDSHTLVQGQEIITHVD